MSAILTEIDLGSLSRPKPLTDDVMVGKDILELLAGSMYADPLTIFREYVQNAADAIDAARDAGVADDFAVSITLDRANRSITIRDNGASIPEAQFVRRLTSIGGSIKRGTSSRGFRGVGRLSGLGYCQQLIFRGRVEGQTRVMEVSWDARRLRELLRSADFTQGLVELVQGIVEVRRLPAEGFPQRFFEVELRKVARLRGDLLLNDDSVRAFLSQVAPVPFHPDFEFGEQIATFLKEKGVADPIDVRLAGDEVPIYHRARGHIEFSPKLVDRIQSVEFLEFVGQAGEPDAFGWLLVHNYLGAVPRRLAFGGVRLRAGNIQVGSDQLLAPLFVEPRFASWAIGDIHVVSPRILPNARRDDFEASVHYAHLQDELTILLRGITQGIRETSVGRNRLRKAQVSLGLADQWLDQAKADALPAALASRVRDIVATQLAAAQKQLDKLPAHAEEAVELRQHMKTVAMRRTRLLRDEPQLGRRSARDKAVDVAISVILEHAATPFAGLQMSKRVLKAFEAS